MPKPASGFFVSTSSGRMPSGPATLAASQAAIASAEGGPTACTLGSFDGLARFRCERGSRRFLSGPLGDDIERTGQEPLAADVALDFAA